MNYKANMPMCLEETLNVRELGGYINGDGRCLKEHRLLRGGDLSRLTKEELEALEAYGIKACIDLRIPAEKVQKNPFNDSNYLVYHGIPIAGEVTLSAAPGELLYKLYVGILEHHKDALARVMKIIAAEKDGLIFHCSAGKDRTGLTAMFILAVCGVCDEQIIADYAASGENNREATKRQLEQLAQSGLTNIPEEIFESAPKTMEKTLGYICEKYGSPVEYLKCIGVEDREIEAIRNKMLED